MKKIIFIILSFVFLFGNFSYVFAQIEETEPQMEETLEGRVVKVLEEKESQSFNTPQYYQKLQILIEKGSLKGNTVEIENGTMTSSNSQKYREGDSVVISYNKTPEGEDIFIIVDFVRRGGLIKLFVVFSILTVMVGSFWGVTSIIAMAFSFLVIFKVILPRILEGDNPVGAAIYGALLIIPVTFVMSHGFKIKTLIAVISTIICLLIVSFLSEYFIGVTRLTGFSAEEAGFLQFNVGSILKMKDILLAGIIIATLGVLDDITISQASIVTELKEANSSITFRELFKRGMSVGRDHIASLVNTMVLVYAGASLPLMLLFIDSPRHFTEIINYEIIAEEIVRTLVASMGLILAVPVTTFLMAYYYQTSFSRKK